MTVALGWMATVRLALRVAVGEFAAQRREDVGHALQQVRPGVGVRVLEVEHHPGRAGVEHLDHQLGVVGGPGHLVALVGAPGGQLDAPVAAA